MIVYTYIIIVLLELLSLRRRWILFSYYMEKNEHGAHLISDVLPMIWKEIGGWATCPPTHQRLLYASIL